MEIRKARKEEIDEITDAYLDAYSGMEKYCYRKRKDVKRYIKWLFGRDASGIFVAVDEKIIAFIASDSFWHSFYEGDVGEIHEMFVRKEYRKKGVGRKIMKRAEEYLTSKGREVMELWVGRENKNAIKFYRKMGYGEKESVGEWIRMVKRMRNQGE